MEGEIELGLRATARRRSFVGGGSVPRPGATDRKRIGGRSRLLQGHRRRSFVGGGSVPRPEAREGTAGGRSPDGAGSYRETAGQRRRSMRSVKWLMVLGMAGCLVWTDREAFGQFAPAAPTYVGLERTIESIR